MFIRKSVVTAALPTTEGALLKIRKSAKPEPKHRLIYDVLGIPSEVMPTRKVWLPTQNSD